MLGWALAFLIIALIAGVLGFGGIAGASAGIAQFLFETFDPMVRKETGGRAWVRQITLHEDTKNKASYQPKA